MKKRNVVAGLVAGALCVGVALPGCAPAKPSAEPANAQENAKETHEVTLHRGYGVGHGDRGFAQVVVAVSDDGTILGANIDEYEYMATDTAGLVPIPNSDKGFGKGYGEGKTLISKKANNDAYSANMKAKKNSTLPWATSMAAIEKSTVGKKPADLMKSKADAISGATLVDIPNYLTLVATVAENNDIVSKGTFEGDGSDLKLGSVLEAAHGDKCFTNAVSLVQGDKIIATSLDDFQYMAATTAGIKPVPNTEGNFGKGAAEGQALVSKAVNSPVYSKSLKEKGGATQDWIVSIQAIQDKIAGTSTKDKAPDTVSGATLVDTPNYAKAAVDAAKAA